MSDPLQQAVAAIATVPVLSTALHEQQTAVRRVWSAAERILDTPGEHLPPFSVSIDPLPPGLLDLDRNIFSTFFIAALHLLPVSPERRRLYADLNHLFRIWVTAADNLLDDEDKSTFCLRMPGRSHVMEQVVSLMTADRILHAVLTEAVEAGVLDVAQALSLSAGTLRVLLPSAAEEAMEEGGLDEWPDPDTVLRELHPLKTGILFQVSFLGPETIEDDMPPARLAEVKDAMMAFGLGCQVLDDVRDMARDLRQRKANYVISLLEHRPVASAERDALHRLPPPGEDDRLYVSFPATVEAAVATARDLLDTAFCELDRLGLDGLGPLRHDLVSLLMHKLDLADLAPPVA